MDRLLYSPEFRRLAGVTQVVPPEDDFHFHDRLSHSIKVAQVAATLARMLVEKADEGDCEDFRSINLEEWVSPEHCYAAGLAHDIGHPPFGHAGEAALQQILEEMGDQDAEFWEADPEKAATHKQSDSVRLAERSFEGNAQSTRVVGLLSFRSDNLDTGLNLTLRTMAAIAKYPWLRGDHPVGQDKLAKKWSFYPEESSILDRLVEHDYVAVDKTDEGVITAVHRWVEAEIMDWADDISYAVHDIDDFYRARLVPLGQILIALDTAPHAVVWHETNFEFVNHDDTREALQFIAQKLRAFQARSRHVHDSAESIEARERDFDATFEQVRLFSKTLKRTSDFSGTREAHADLRRFSSAVIKYLSGVASLDFNRSTGRVQLSLEPVGVLVAEFFKAINSYFVIESINLAAMQYGQESNLFTLFSGLLELSTQWVEKRAEGVRSSRLPARLQSYLSTQVQTDGADESVIAIAVLDYITSLRDAQAGHLASQLAGSRETTPVAVAWLNN